MPDHEKVMQSQIRSSEDLSRQVRLDVAGTVRNNFVLEQVMTISEHIWSGQVRADQVTRDHVRALISHVGRVSSVQVRSGQVIPR